MRRCIKRRITSLYSGASARLAGRKLVVMEPVIVYLKLAETSLFEWRDVPDVGTELDLICRAW